MKFVPTKEMGPKGETKEEMEKKMQQRVTGEEWILIRAMRTIRMQPVEILYLAQKSADRGEDLKAQNLVLFYGMIKEEKGGKR